VLPTVTSESIGLRRRVGLGLQGLPVYRASDCELVGSYPTSDSPSRSHRRVELSHGSMLDGPGLGLRSHHDGHVTARVGGPAGAARAPAAPRRDKAARVAGPSDSECRSVIVLHAAAGCFRVPAGDLTGPRHSG
jgi:hypothetical protein